VFSTASDSQTSVEVHVLQGERPMASANRTLGKFHLDGIPPAPRGIPQVEVTFDIDANGIVNVSARDKATGKEQRISIEAGSGISERDIEKMVTDAREHEADDKKRREDIDLKNKADSMCYSVERSLKEYADKLDAATREDLEKKIKESRAAIESGDAARIKSTMEALTQASHKMAEKMYQAAGAGGPSAGGPQPGAGAPGGGAPEGEKTSDKDKKNGRDSNVVDAEFEEN